MKTIWDKYKIDILYICIFLLLICLLFYFIDKRDKLYKIEADQLRAKFLLYQQDYNSAKDKINKQQSIIDSLLKVKQIKDIEYVQIIKEFGNPYVISNDSITKYIATKIHNQR